MSAGEARRTNTVAALLESSAVNLPGPIYKPAVTLRAKIDWLIYRSGSRSRVARKALSFAGS